MVEKTERHLSMSLVFFSPLSGVPFSLSFCVSFLRLDGYSLLVLLSFSNASLLLLLFFIFLVSRGGGEGVVPFPLAVPLSFPLLVGARGRYLGTFLSNVQFSIFLLWWSLSFSVCVCVGMSTSIFCFRFLPFSSPFFFFFLLSSPSPLRPAPLFFLLSF